MNDILLNIISRRKQDVAEAKKLCSLETLEATIGARPPARDFAAAFAEPGIRIIAEVKKASPSKGLIRTDFRPLEFAKELAASGAAALSVLTEPNFFQGDLRYLEAISSEVAIPALRKDFIFDPYQIYEARAAGADAVLLIAAMLDDAELNSLGLLARKLGMAVLGEAHDTDEVRRLLDSPATLIGVNARNLRTFATDLNVTADLIGTIPAERLPVAESAIRSPDDIAMLRAAGAAGFLIGETLMRAPSPGVALRELMK